jgi:hypothetical protein
VAAQLNRVRMRTARRLAEPDAPADLLTLWRRVMPVDPEDRVALARLTGWPVEVLSALWEGKAPPDAFDAPLMVDLARLMDLDFADFVRLVSAGVTEERMAAYLARWAVIRSQEPVPKTLHR